MVIPKYTSYEIMQISGVILKAIHEQITNFENQYTKQNKEIEKLKQAINSLREGKKEN